MYRSWALKRYKTFYKCTKYKTKTVKTNSITAWGKTKQSSRYDIVCELSEHTPG